MKNLEKNSQTIGKEVTFEALLLEWLVCIKPKVKKSTYAKYSFDVERHIIPVIGEVDVNAATTYDIDAFVNFKLSEGKLSGKGGLSPKVVNDLLSIIKIALDYGIEHQLVTNTLKIHSVNNRMPSIKILKKSDQSTLEHYLIKNINATTIGILLSLFTGLRIGEVCGLKWGDFSFDEQTVLVTRTVTRIQHRAGDGKKTMVVIDRPKSDCSIREIPVPDFLFRILENERRGDEVFLLSGTTLCCEPRNYYRKYKEIMTSLNLSQYNYHALRHTFATRCIEYGVDIKSLSEILGHSDVNVTMSRYVHPSIEHKRKQLEMFVGESLCAQISSKNDI